jgi:hypothetical protein
MRLRTFRPTKIPPAAFATLILLFAGAAQPAEAHRHRIVVHESVVVRHPVYTHVVVRGSHYYFHDGYYYRHHRGRYFLAPAPLGVVVPVLPPGAVRLHRGGARWYYFGGYYYQEAPQGYVVVSKPDTVYVERTPAAAATDAAAEEKFAEPSAKTVMVKNSNGSETPVRVEEVDGKWKGPRGEVYEAFPTEDQLRSAYGF